MTQSTGITTTRLKMLAAIQSFSREHGYPPTYKDLQAMLGITRAGCRYHILLMQLDGFVRREAGLTRTLTITPTGLAALEAAS